MRKVKLQPTKPSAKPEEKSMKVSPDTSNYKPKGSAFPSNFKPSGKGFSTKKEELNMTPSSNPSARKMIEKENIKQAIKNAAKKGKLD